MQDVKPLRSVSNIFYKMLFVAQMGIHQTAKHGACAHRPVGYNFI